MNKFLFLILLLMPSFVRAQELTPYQWHEVSTEFNYNIDAMVKGVTAYDDYTKILPYVDSIKIIYQRGPEAICYLQRNLGAKTFWMQIRIRLMSKRTPDSFALKIKYLDGNAHPYDAEIILKRINDKKTLLISRMKIEYPGPSFIPDSVINQYIDHFLTKSH
jgi:hypothetical protein